MNYIKITKVDIANGPGCRTVLWVSGCNHECKGCHNPQTWDCNAGKEFNDNTMQELLDSLEPDYIAGLTFSGGDPLHPNNRDAVMKIAEKVRQQYPQKSIWLWTGFLWEEIKNIYGLNNIDVIVDGPYIEAQRNISLPYSGSMNQRVLDVKKSLELNHPVLYSNI